MIGPKVSDFSIRWLTYWKFLNRAKQLTSAPDSFRLSTFFVGDEFSIENDNQNPENLHLFDLLTH